MRILLVSQAFPPYNASGVIRVGQLAAYLLDAGHDVRVLTAAPLPYPRTLSSRVPAERVTTTPSMDPFALLAWWRKRQSGSAAPLAGSLVGEGATGGFLRTVGSVFAFPDAQIGWYPFAVRAGLRLCRTWKPDVIYASALPFTGHLVAARLASRLGVPWLAEFRDHFAGNPYSKLPGWRAPLDLWCERRVLTNVSACVGVSGPIAATLRERHGRPAVVVTNGFDDSGDAARAAYVHDPGAPIRILYTGVIYPGRRDPTPLFAALQQLGADRHGIEVVFHGQDLRGVADSAARHGVADVVHVEGPIGYTQSLDEQRRADVLLLLLYSDPSEVGVYTGKLFEYVGAGRPILAVGSDSGAAADLIRERELGTAATDPGAIAATLRRWLAEKRTPQGITAPAASARAGLSRTEQFRILGDLLQQVCSTGDSGQVPADGIPGVRAR